MNPMDKQTRRVLALVRTDSKAVLEAFKNAISAASAAVDMPALIKALEAGQIEEAVRLLRLTTDQLFLLEDAIRTTYMAAGIDVAQSAPAPVKASFGFNGRSPAAEAYITSVSSTLIQGIADDTLIMAREVILRGMARGEGVAGIARKITGKVVAGRRVGGFLGLTTQQAGYVDNMADMLKDPNRIGEYFIGRDANGKGIPRYKLSDRRYDRVVQKAINEGKALEPGTISEISAAHRSKALTRRGQDIAKDQVFSSQSAARQDAYAQIAARPDVESVTKRWQHNLSEFPREDHVAMSGKVVAYDATFNFPDAQMQRPHDPAGGAKHSLGCRCIAVYRINMVKA